MSDPYLERLLDVQSEIDGIDIRISSLEQGYSLDPEEVEQFVKEHRSNRTARYEDFLSIERLEEIQNQYKEELNKGVDCDAWDYGLSALIGGFCGVIDAFFCSSPHEGVLAKGVDDLFGGSVMKFAKITGWNPKEGNEPQKHFLFRTQRGKRSS